MVKRCWPLVITVLIGLLVLPRATFADITWDPVYQGFAVTDDEYFVDVSEGSTGAYTFSGGKFVNPQNGYFLTITVVVKGLALASVVDLDVTFGDGYTLRVPAEKNTNIPSAYFADHPSKGITLKFISDGRKDYKAYLSGYGLKDYDGPGPTTAPTTKPTPAPTVKPTAAPTVKPTVAPTPGKTASPNPTPGPTAGATSGATAQPTTPPGSDDPDPGGGEPECTAACQAIIDQLECPQWGDYMGEWASMLRSVIPPPPDWDMVADKIGAATVNHIAAWVGYVPDPPSKEEIDSETVANLPSVDTSVETNGLVPQVPGDYSNGKINFDLNQNAPTIQVVDESQPFTITDPLADMPHDDPGVKVLPGDPRNSTGGFKQPDKVDTGDPAPTPGKVVFELPRPSPPIPAATTGPAPTPGAIVFDLPRPSPAVTTGPPPTPGKIIFELPPVPGSTSSVVPTPGAVDSIIPIPKGGE